MEKQQLYNLLNERCRQLQQDLVSLPIEENNFIIDYYNENNVKDPWVCKNIDEDKLFFWALSVETYFDKTKTPQQLYELNDKFFKRLDLRTLCSFKIQLDGLSEQMIKVAEDCEIDITDPNVLKKEWADIKDVINEKMKLNNIDLLEKLIELKLTYPTSFDNCILYIISIKKFKSIILKTRKEISEQVKLSPLEIYDAQDVILKETMQDLYDGNCVGQLTNIILSKYQAIYNEYKKNEKEKASIETKIKTYKALPEKVDKLLTAEEITDFKDIILGLEEPIKVALLTLLNDHNQKSYEGITESYMNTVNDKKINYRLLLRKYNITEDIYQDDESKILSLKDLETALIELTNLGIKDPSVLSKIISCASITGINNLSKYIKRGIIKLEFIRNNPQVFDITSEVYKTATGNIQNLISSGITPTYIMENQDVLLIPTSSVEAGIKTLEDYNLKLSLTPQTPSSLFEEENLDQKLDTIIELGYENALIQNLSLASYSKKDWKKIQLLRLMNIEVEESDLETVLKNNSFIVAEDEIDNYITKALSTSDDIKLNSLKPQDGNINNPLQSFRVSPLSYQIGGVIVSSKKVERNLKKLANIEMPDSQKLLLSIKNNLVITQDEQLSITKSLGIINK